MTDPFRNGPTRRRRELPSVDETEATSCGGRCHLCRFRQLCCSLVKIQRVALRAFAVILRCSSRSGARNFDTTRRSADIPPAPTAWPDRGRRKDQVKSWLGPLIQLGIMVFVGRPKEIAVTIEEFRTLALSLPDATEGAHMGHDSRPTWRCPYEKHSDYRRLWPAPDI